MFLLSEQTIDPAALRARLACPQAGALSVFEGWVRNQDGGRPVASLEYEAAAELCDAEGGRIMAEAQNRFALLDAVVVHRTGHLLVGDLAVWIGVTASHRDAAFAACRFLIEEIKQRLPVWKKEHYADGRAGWIGI